MDQLARPLQVGFLKWPGKTLRPAVQRWGQIQGLRFINIMVDQFRWGMPTAAAFMSHATAKSASKVPASFGKGSLHGIAAAESANPAVAGSSLIPHPALGIPGSAGAALIMANLLNLWGGQLGCASG